MKFSVLFFVFLLVSCAHTPQKTAMSEEQKDQLNREALVNVAQEMEQMIAQVRNNPEASKYLATDLFLKANQSLIEDDYSSAAVLFKYVSELEPNDLFIQKKYAVSLIKAGEVEAAEPVLASLYKNGKEEKVGLILAGVYAGLDKEEKAREVYAQILKVNPKSEDACVFLGKSYALAKQTARALDLLRQCAKRDPKNGMYDYYAGKIWVDSGKMSKALESFKMAVKRQPNLGQAAVALGIIYEESEQHERAIAVYKKYLEKHPNEGKILSRLVQLLFSKERYAEVIAYSERLSDLDPENLNLKVKLGVLYSDAKRYPEAISVFKDLLTHAPTSDKILYYLGAIYQEIDKYQESIEYFNQIPESSGLYTDSAMQMANMLSHLAQHDENFRDEFFTHLNSKLEKLPEFKVELSVIKAGYFESIGDYKNAMDSLMVVMDEKKFSPQHKYYLANMFEKEKRFDESTDLIMGIIKEEPKNAHAWNFLGYAILERGTDLKKAFEYISKAKEISPDDGYIRDSLGWYYYKTGDLKRAQAEIEYAYKQVPDDLEILKHMAQIYSEIGKHERARNVLEEAKKYARHLMDLQHIETSLKDLEAKRLPASAK